MKLRWKRAVAGLIAPCLVGLGAAATATPVASSTTGPGLTGITEAANHANARCNGLMHDNADEYVVCIDALADAVKGHTQLAQRERLGVWYFGWVGAEHWSRVGLPGADEAAKRYFLRFRPLQQQFGISDAALCPVAPGDCNVRLAQIKVAERDYQALPAGRAKAAH